MKKEKVLLRKTSFLQKWTAVFLSAVLMMGMIQCAEPAEVRAAEAVTASAVWEDGTSVSAVTITGGGASNPVVITVHGNVTVSGTITVSSGYVKFTGGGTLQWTGGSSNAMVVEQSANAVFENVTIDGNHNTFSRSAFLFYGNVSLKAGTTVRNFRSSGGSGSSAGYKGMIAVYGNGILNLYDGVTITGNTCGSGIIALYQYDNGNPDKVSSTAVVNMHGGTITGNTVNNSNLGVIWNWCGNLNISGGTVTAEGSEYAVHTQGNHSAYNATTKISGGTFTGNQTGAVCAGKDSTNQSVITITGGTFTGKIAATVNYGTIDIRGGKYTGSSYALSSSGNGGGTLTVHGGEFFGNIKAYNGSIITQTQKVIVGDSASSVNNWDRSTSLNTYRYVAIGEVAGAHVHQWTKEWNYDDGHHWHECGDTNCPETDNAKKDGYAEHIEDEGIVTTEPTEDAEGVKTYYCSVCGCALRTEPIEKLPPVHNHDWSESWKNNDTHHWHECDSADCDITEDADKNGYGAHAYGDWITDQEATETEEGTRHRECTECGCREEETIPVKEHEHSYSADWKTDSGSHWHECGECGNQTDKAAHAYEDWVTDQEATETEEGTRHRECTECGCREEETIPVKEHEHSYSADWKTDSGSHWHECGECGNQTDKAAHAYGDWVTDQEATQTEEGAKHRECTECGYLEEETIPATGGGNTGGGDNTGGDNTGGNTGGDNTGGGNTGGSNTGGGDNSGSTGSGSNTASGADGDSGSGENGNVGNSSTGYITPEVIVKENVPATAFATPEDELAGLLLTEQEKQMTQGGTDIRIVLNVEDMSERVDETEKALVESVLQDWRVGQYLDISLFKLIGEQRTQITETAGKIRITLAIPGSLRRTAGTAGEDSMNLAEYADASGAAQQTFYAILRVHNGQPELLPDLDNNGDTITVETDRFSTYVLILLDKEMDGADTAGTDIQNGGASDGENHADGNEAGTGTESADGAVEQAKDDEPKTGSFEPAALYATLSMIAGLTYLLLYFADHKRGMTEETKKELVSKLTAWAKQGRIWRRYLALAAVFMLLVYYHSIGKKTAVEWTEIYGKQG